MLQQLTAAQPVAPAAAEAAPEAKPAEGAKVSAPLSFKIGDSEWTPGGFMDFTNIYRSNNIGSGIGTSFSGVPFGNTAAGVNPEDRLSAQNSRLTLKITSKVFNTDVTGYLESDFLGNAPANLNVTSNGNVLRMRLYWVDLVKCNFEVLAGQSWSMLTPGRKGISPAPSDLFYSQDIDTNYQMGLIWTRAPQIRLIYHASKDFALGFALENPQQFVGTAAVMPSLVGTQLDANATTSTPNIHPDVQAKMAYDAQYGGRQVLHLEASGVFRTFRIAGAAPALAHSEIHGGGGSVNGILEPVKNFRLIATSFWSSGGGRYIGNVNAPDVVVRANGTLSGVHSGSGIGGFEAQASPKLLLYGYFSAAYIRRNWGVPASGTALLGYGFPGSANSANRLLEEGTVGFTYSFWKNPKYGALQLMNSYSYLYRVPWAPPTSGPVNAHSHMVFTNLRYLLP